MHIIGCLKETHENEVEILSAVLNCAVLTETEGDPNRPYVSGSSSDQKKKKKKKTEE